MSEEVRATFDRFASAWDAHDVEAMADCWIDEGNAIDLWGKLAVGRAGVIELLASEHKAPMRDSRYRLLSVNVRELSPESVVAECEAVIDDVRAPNGRLYQLKHRLDAVLVKRDGAWRFMSIHPSF
ncbi:MAG: SnoaL-like domain [Acidobacteriota bacterium]|jgi:uncharacterized protein (TIGR02246 family)|nr:SnoaL-like domain [Acidobacteriota bacterium]